MLDKELNIMGKKIGVLMGGSSAEREISIKSGVAVAKALKSKGYDVVEIDCGKGPDVIDSIKNANIEVAYITLHGGYGENGCIQGLLDVMGIPYTGSGVKACAVAMDKVMAKQVLMYHKIPTADFIEVTQGTEYARGIDLPVIVKPSTQGSTIGITVVRIESEMKGAIEEAFKYSDKVLVESFIEGREITCAVLDDLVLPLVEIRPKGGIYDFDAKYSKEKTEFITPPAIDDKLKAKIEDAALRSYNALDCEAIARIDFMIDKDENLFVLEINTVPGMTEMSLVPMAALEAGISYEDLTEKVLELAIKKGLGI